LKIDELRKKIDDVDNSILKLFEQRMEYAREIGEYKKQNSLPIRNRERERKILCRLCEKTRPEFSEYIKSLFSSLMDMSSNYQESQMDLKKDI